MHKSSYEIDKSEMFISIYIGYKTTLVKLITGLRSQISSPYYKSNIHEFVISKLKTKACVYKMFSRL
jgi:hypothetical protein